MRLLLGLSRSSTDSDLVHRSLGDSSRVRTGSRPASWPIGFPSSWFPEASAARQRDGGTVESNHKLVRGTGEGRWSDRRSGETAEPAETFLAASAGTRRRRCGSGTGCRAVSVPAIHRARRPAAARCHDRTKVILPAPLGPSTTGTSPDSATRPRSHHLRPRAVGLARSASASQPLRATSRNSSNPWSCVVTKPPMLGLEMPQSENSTGMLPCTSIAVPVRSAFSVNVTERV